MKYHVAAESLTGRVRKNNEDNYSVDEAFLPELHTDTEPLAVILSDKQVHLLGVFDGMGGHQDGETASFLTAVTAARYAAELNFRTPVPKMLLELCQEANDTVCQEADGSRMGSTCALLCLKGNAYTVCNVGDSPVFLLRHGQLRQLTADDNQRAYYERITGTPAPPNQKYKLTQCIGIPSDEMLIEPHIHTGKLQNGDIFLLCSDGITDMLPLEAIRGTLMEADSAPRAAAALSGQALAAGGRDNLTLICVKVEACSFQDRMRSILKI